MTVLKSYLSLSGDYGLRKFRNFTPKALHVFQVNEFLVI